MKTLRHGVPLVLASMASLVFEEITLRSFVISCKCDEKQTA